MTRASNTVHRLLDVPGLGKAAMVHSKNESASMATTVDFKVAKFGTGLRVRPL